MDPKDESKKLPVAESSALNGDNLQDLVDSLKSVDIRSPNAKSNETSMSDNNGKRIIFNEDHLKNKTFKGVEAPRGYKKI